MRRPLLAFTVLAALAAGGGARAQSVTCQDGTVLTGPNARRMCVAHGGLPVAAPGSPAMSNDAQRSLRPPSAPAQAQGRGDPFSNTPETPGNPASAPVVAPSPARQAARPGGGPGQVWVNTSSKAYHCPGTQYYGRTRRGDYMTEAAAKAAGAHPAGGHACS